jgi:hypothetical protein
VQVMSLTGRIRKKENIVEEKKVKKNMLRI